MSQSDHGHGRSSDILDAILDKVADDTTRTATTSSLFRAKALEQLDVAADIDNQLPLVARRSWLLLVGAGFIVMAFVLWAALTPSSQSVSGDARVVAPTGLVPVTSPIFGVVQEVSVRPGTPVAARDTIATVESTTSQQKVTTVAAGIAWQVLAVPGSAAIAGGTVATVLPEGSDRTALLPLTVADSALVRPGMKVSAGGEALGEVTAVEPPLPAREVALRTGIDTLEGTDYVLVHVSLLAPMTPGMELPLTVVLSDNTVLQQLLAR